MPTKSSSTNPTLNAIIKGLKKEDLEATKRSFNELQSKKNAYSCSETDEQKLKWNMITYKKENKSSL